MRDTIAWSYDLLTPDEQTLLRRLAVFAGGWTFEALEAVCAGDGIAPFAELELLGGLVERSLVAVEERPDGARYALLETVRQYAAEQLAARGEAAAIQERHAAHFRALAEAAEPALFSGAETVRWLGRLEREYDNLRAALQWASEAGKAEEGLRLGAALWRFWWIRGQYAEGLLWLGRLRARAASDHAAGRTAGALARATHGAALLAWSQGDHPTVGALAGESVALAREAGDRRTEAWALGTLGLVAWAGNDYERARALYEQSLGIFRALDDRLGIARTLNNLGEEAQTRGDWDRALALYEECLALDRKLGNREGMAFRLHNLGQVDLHRDQPERAAAMLAESLGLFQELGHMLGVMMNLAALGAVASAAGTAHFARAARLFGAATALRERRGVAQHAPVAEQYARQVAAAREGLGPADFAAAWAEGEALTPEQAVAYALRRDDEPVAR
jgi:tetratricopeptide (TPR) repeat protein